MITIKQWMLSIDFKVTNGSIYYLDGGELLLLECYMNEQDVGSSIVFDPRTQEVIVASVYDYGKEAAYRLTTSTTEKLMKAAWDDVNYVNLIENEDFLDKLEKIIKGEPYDDRVLINCDIPTEDLLVLFRAAHAKDITLNQFIEEALMEILPKA